MLDCADPGAQAEFWAAALGYVVQPPPPGHASWEDFLRQLGVPRERWNDRSAVVDPDGRGPRIYLQRVPESKTVKNRVHLDVQVGVGVPPEQRRARVEDEVQRLVGLGATEQQAARRWASTGWCCATRRATSSASPETSPGDIS